MHRPVFAAPLSELILRPDGVLAAAGTGTAAGREPVVIISRSGSTSEAVEVAARMRDAGHPTIAVTCRGDSPLASAADVALVSPAGDEAAIVMTRSFASMLALLLRLVASVAGDDRLATGLAEIPRRWSEATAAAAVGRRLGATDWRRVVILGGGPAYGIAAEWGLKLTETSQVPTSAYEPLEFRHGPISVCEPGTLVVGLVGGPVRPTRSPCSGRPPGSGRRPGCSPATPTRPAPRLGEVSHVGGGLHAAARLPLLVHPAHALALSLALTRGCDPDAPRHLGQVVILDRE